MAQCKVSLSANAGVSLQLGGHRIWVDALHKEPVPGFSSLSPALWAQLQERETFQNPDVICFTHCHNDHFDLHMAQQAAAQYPGAGLILPEPLFDRQLLLTGREMHFSYQGLTFRFFRLPHEGAQYAAVPHYGMLLSHGSFNILVAGDCETASPDLAAFLKGVSVDLAILNFPWLTLRKGTAFLQDTLRPRHLLVTHLPFEADDQNGFRYGALMAAGQLDLPDVRLLADPLQEELYLYEP